MDRVSTGSGSDPVSGRRAITSSDSGLYRLTRSLSLSVLTRANKSVPAAVRAAAEQQQWSNLCSKYLPVEIANSDWKYSRAYTKDDLSQGWKLHIAATILSANKVLATVAPVLRRRGVLFKAPTCLEQLQKLNSGVHYGYCQVGKFITVYPRSLREARSLARKLDQLTHGVPAPAVPFDTRYRQDSCVFYRYGAFERLLVDVEDGLQVPGLRNPEGNLVPDNRYTKSARPDWVLPLFKSNEAGKGVEQVNPLTTTFRVIESLSQRGKGGVYKAIDFSQNQPRLCLLKEGRQSGETSWDGRDGKWLVQREEEVLRLLSVAGVPVPAVYESFELNSNYYLVTEFIEGETLESLLKKRRRRLRLNRALSYSVQLASLLYRIHEAGWVWRDCKPANIIVTKRDELRLIDFEGAWPVNGSDSRLWATPGFYPTAWRDMSGTQADLYAFATVTYYLLTGSLPEENGEIRVLRKNVPAPVWALLRELLVAKNRLDAPTVLQQLKAALDEERALHTF